MDTEKSDKQKREEQALATHKRLSQLFVNDRMAFERERREIIRNFIEQHEPQRQKDLKELQDKVDHVLHGAKSPHNRLVLMKMLFWDQIHNKFLPALNNVVQASSEENFAQTEERRAQIKLCKRA